MKRIAVGSGGGRCIRNLAAIGVLATCTLLFAMPSSSSATVKCESAPSPPYVASKTITRLSPANERTTKPPAINLGTSRESLEIAPYTFLVTGPMPDLTKMSWDFLLVDGNRTFPDSHAAVNFSNSLGSLRVKVCLSPAEVATGSYSGSLTLAGPGVKPIQLPLTVNLKDNNVAIIWAGIVLAAIAAVFFKWWTMKVADSQASNGASLKQFVNWLKVQWVTVLIAVTGAAGAVYVTKYRNLESFVPADRWGLWVATFTAVMSASLLLNALGIAVEPKKNKTAH